jgi:hypothetical protein
MGILDLILQHVTWPLTAFFGGITTLIVSIIMFREQLAILLSKMPGPLAQVISNVSLVKYAVGKHTFQIEFGEQVQKAKVRAKGLEETVAASRAMPVPNLVKDLDRQTGRDMVLAAWGALRQIVYDACTANKLPLTPATRIPEAVRRLADAHAINAEIASLIDVLYRLGQALATDTALRPLEEDARSYKELADVVVDWMMLGVLTPAKVEDSKHVQIEELKPLRKTVVGGHFLQPGTGHPAALLVGIGGAVRGQRFSIDKEHYRIGSKADNDLRIKGDGYVSGYHASLRYEKGSLYLTDQRSRNGTFLNEERVAGSAFLVRQGDQIRLGESIFQVAELSG